MVSNAVVLEYSSQKPLGFVKKENKYGEYICFRILEKRYNSRPLPWLCICNGQIADRISSMKLTPGDQITVSGELNAYTDEEKKRDSFRLIVSGIDFNYSGMKNRKPDADKKEAKQLEKDVNSIDLSQCDIFKNHV